MLANFRHFKTERVAEDNFKSDENGRKFSKWENTKGKAEIAHDEQFQLFPVLLKDLYYRHVKMRACLVKA